MSRRSKGRDINGILLLDKPAGLSSNKILQKVKWLYQAKKAGHTGSLDPLATGMLPICFGAATKISSFLLDSSKHYRVIGTLGTATDTGDEEGSVIETCALPGLDEQGVEKVLAQFRGDISQIPPMYSALKHHGKRLYDIARQGETVERPARNLTIHALELINYDQASIELQVHCSKGTYIRTLVEDIAKALGSCGHVHRLHRTVVDPFDTNTMISFEAIEKASGDGHAALDKLLIPADAGLRHLPEVHLSEAQSKAILFGQAIELSEAINLEKSVESRQSTHAIDAPGKATAPAHAPQLRSVRKSGINEKWLRIYANDQRFLGVGSTNQAILYPKRLFVSQ